MATEKIIITQGEKATFELKIRTKDGDPFDLTDFDKFTVCFQSEISGTPIEVTETVNANGSVIAIAGSPLLGTLAVTVGGADTQNLKLKSSQDFYLELDNVATPNPKRKTLEAALNVIEYCPT